MSKKRNRNSRKKHIPSTVTEMDSETTVESAESAPEAIEPAYPVPVARWEILPLNEDSDQTMLVTYDEEGTPLNYLILTEEYAGGLVTALNNELGLVVSTPDEWVFKVPEDSKEPPKLHFLSHGAITASVPLSEPLLKDLMPKLLTVYDPRKKEAGSIVPWINKHRIKTGLLIMLLVGTLGYGTFTYFF